MDTKRVDSLREELHLVKFENELNFMEEQNLSITKEREDYLRKIIDHEKQSTIKSQIPQQTEYQQLITDIQKGMYHKPWNRLPDIHKRHKFQEFIQNKTNDKNIQQKLSEQFEERLKKGLDKTVKAVSYSVEEEKIVSIKDLVLDDEYMFVESKPSHNKKKMIIEQPKKTRFHKGSGKKDE